MAARTMPQALCRRLEPGRAKVAAEAYVPLPFVPGEAYQFDLSHEIVLINGVAFSKNV